MSGKADIVSLLNGGYVSIRADKARQRIALHADSHAGSVHLNSTTGFSAQEARDVAARLVAAADLIEKASK